MTIRWAIVLSTLPAMVLVSLDTTMVNVALPSIGTDLGADTADLQWVLTAFTLSLVAALPVSGGLGDLYGKRRIAVVGFAAYFAGTALAGSSSSLGALLLGRVAAGAGVALLFPNALALVVLSVPPAQRGRTVGTWTALASIGFLVGPIGGGWLVDRYGWTSVFRPTLVVAVIGIGAILRWVDEAVPVRATRPDVRGMLVAGVSLFGLTFALVEGGRRGFDAPPVIVAALVGILGLALFARVERRASHPMFDPDLVRRPAVGGVLSITTVSSMANLTAFFLLTIYLQSLRGLSATGAGVMLLAVTGAMAISPLLGGWITDRYGYRLPVLASLLTSAASLGLLSLAGADTPLTLLMVPMFLTGLAGGTYFAAASTAVVSAVPTGQSSAASASLSAARQVGATIGIALFGSLAAIFTRRGFTAATAGWEPAPDVDAAVGFATPPAAADSAVVEAVRDASLEAFSSVLLLAAVLVAAVGVVGWRALGAHDRTAPRAPLPPRHPTELTQTG